MPKDPRIGGATVNEVLQDLAIRHGISIEKFKGSEVKKLLDILAEADAKALEKLERRLRRLGPVELQTFGNGRVRTERLIAVREALDETADRAFDIMQANLGSIMTEVGKAEYAFQAAAIATTVDVADDWITPSNTLLRQLVRARPFEGRLLREHTKQWSRGRKERAMAALRTAIILGDGIPEAVGRVKSVLDASHASAERITRTGIAHITNSARAETYIANRDVLKGVKWVATLDSRTCAVCGSLDGKVYAVATARRPPAHFNCRCVMVPITKASIGKGMRWSSTGDVPRDVTFPEWLKRQDIESQEDVLGVTGAQLFRKGKLKLDGFVDKSGNPFTLDELARKNVTNFKRAGLDPKEFKKAS